MDLGDVVDIRPTAVLATKLDRGGALLAGVANRLAHHPEVGLPVMGYRQLQPFRLGNAFTMQQGLAELVLDVKVGSGREDEVGDLVPFVAQGIDDLHGRVDVTLGGSHHANDLEVAAQLTTLATFEYQP